MRKLFLIVVFISSTLYGADFFSGISIDATTGVAKASKGNSIIEPTTGGSLKLGLSHDKLREYVDYTYTKWKNAEANMATFNVEYLLFIAKSLPLIHNPAAIFAGVHIGSINFKTELTDNKFKSSSIYGAQIGFASPLGSDHLILEGGAKLGIADIYTKSEYVEYNLKSLLTWQLGVSYAF